MNSGFHTKDCNQSGKGKCTMYTIRCTCSATHSLSPLLAVTSCSPPVLKLSQAGYPGSYRGSSMQCYNCKGSLCASPGCSKTHNTPFPMLQPCVFAYCSVRMLVHVLVEQALDLIIEHQHQRSARSPQHIGPGPLHASNTLITSWKTLFSVLCHVPVRSSSSAQPSQKKVCMIGLPSWITLGLVSCDV